MLDLRIVNIGIAGKPVHILCIIELDRHVAWIPAVVEDPAQ
jgi:hypothetical protein